MPPNINPENNIGDIIYSNSRRGAKPKWILGTDRNFQRCWIEYSKVTTRIY